MYGDNDCPTFSRVPLFFVGTKCQESRVGMLTHLADIRPSDLESSARSHLIPKVLRRRCSSSAIATSSSKIRKVEI